MKIWNEEIHDCQWCKYPRNINGVEVCGYNTKINLNNREYIENKGWSQKVPEQCPFKSVITKEVMLSFGFEFITTQGLGHIFKYGQYDICIGNELYFSDSIFINNEIYMVDNVEHLKFILITKQILNPKTNKVWKQIV